VCVFGGVCMCVHVCVCAFTWYIWGVIYEI